MASAVVENYRIDNPFRSLLAATQSAVSNCNTSFLCVGAELAWIQSGPAGVDVDGQDRRRPLRVGDHSRALGASMRL
jgi:hypothetical protein